MWSEVFDRVPKESAYGARMTAIEEQSANGEYQTLLC
jgi:hypothetical protein